MRESWQSFFGRERGVRRLVRHAGFSEPRIRTLTAQLMAPRRRAAPLLPPEQAARALLTIGSPHTPPRITCMCSPRCCEVYSAYLKASIPSRFTAAQLRTNVHAAQEAAPMNSTVQSIRERTAEVVAESNAVNRAAEQFVATRRALRPAEGKRHSAADMQQLQDIHDKLHAQHDAIVGLGVDCPESQTRAASACPAPDPYAAGIAARRAAAPPTRAEVVARNAEVRAAQSPDADPNYDPRGVPPDAYALALARRKQ